MFEIKIGDYFFGVCYPIVSRKFRLKPRKLNSITDLDKEHSIYRWLWFNWFWGKGLRA
jgi:hypothetical protein